MGSGPDGPFSNVANTALGTPNGPFPNYVEQSAETERQYLDRIFGEWLAWVKQSERLIHDE